MIYLMTPFWYDCPNADRHEELMSCLIKNSQSCFSEKTDFLLFADYSKQATTAAYKKLKGTSGFVAACTYAHEIEKSRPTYQDFFDFSHSPYRDSEALWILANSDILIEPHVLDELNQYVTSNMFLCLTRWMPSVYKGLWSLDPLGKYCQDTWVWRGPCRIENANFPLGIPRCDHMIAKAAVDEKYDVLNPSLDIVTKHMHDVEYRSYTSKDRVDGIGVYVQPRRK